MHKGSDESMSGPDTALAAWKVSRAVTRRVG